MASINAPGTRLLTTPQVLLECANAAARKPYRSEVCLLRRRLLSQGNLIIPSDAELEQAWAAYERDIAGGASIVDHISFPILRRLAITDVFTNDRHFKTAGFNPLF